MNYEGFKDSVTIDYNQRVRSWKEHIGDVCEKGNHFAPDVEGGGCGGGIYAGVYVVVEQERNARYGVQPDVVDIVNEINLALKFFADHGRPGWEPK